jgi:hypothetical protein
MRFKLVSRLFLSLFLLFIQIQSAQAAGILNFNYIDPNNLGSAVPQNVANEAIKMFGIYTAHRPYSGATSIGKYGSFDFLVEGTLVKLGPGLINALNQDGIAGTPPAIPAVPIAKISIRKSFGDRVDFGVSGLYYRAQLLVGGDLKIVLHDAEEGPSFAFRLGYTYAEVPYAYIKNCSTLSPELVMSQSLGFAEPYIGIGGRYIEGTISVPFQGVAPLFPDFTVEKSGHAETAYAFTGVFFRIFSPGLRLGMEGTFDVSGYSTIGGVFGIGF